MTIKLNHAGFEHAKKMIAHGFEVEHDEDNWSEVAPDRDEKASFLNTHDLDEYGLWFLGIDSSVSVEDAAKYVYPSGDFSVIQKSGLLAAAQEAQQKGHTEIKKAADELLSLF